MLFQLHWNIIDKRWFCIFKVCSIGMCTFLPMYPWIDNAKWLPNASYSTHPSPCGCLFLCMNVCGEESFELFPEQISRIHSTTVIWSLELTHHISESGHPAPTSPSLFLSSRPLISICSTHYSSLGSCEFHLFRFHMSMSSCSARVSLCGLFHLLSCSLRSPTLPQVAGFPSSYAWVVVQGIYTYCIFYIH